MRGWRSSVMTAAKVGQGRRISPPEPYSKPRGPLQAGVSPIKALSREHAARTKATIPLEKALKHKRACKAGERMHLRDNLAPVVRVPSPACQSLPWPKDCLRDQAARARTTGKPVPPGGFGTSPNAPGDVSQSLGLRVPVSAGDGPPPPSRSQNKCPAKMHTPSPLPLPPRSWSRSSSSKPGMEALVPSPPMKSTVTRS